MKKKAAKWKYILLGFLLVVGLLVRLYRIDNSITEWFSWRQTDTAAVGRFLQKDKFNLLKPRYYDLSNIQSGEDNPHGWRMVEFPVYNASFAFLAQTFSFLSLEIWARIVTIVFSLILLVVVYLLLVNEYSLSEAFFGGLFIALSPYVVFYSRTILPEVMAISLTFLTIYFIYRYWKKDWFSYWLAVPIYALALLVKPTAIFFLPAIIYLIVRYKKHSWLRKGVDIVVFLVLSSIPVILWRLHIQQYPEGIPWNIWLYTLVNTSGGVEKIFFRPAFFRWIFFERISNLILGGYLIFFTLMGLLMEIKTKLKLNWALAACALFYLFTFQGGNVQHEYYQIMIVPVIAYLIGTGAGYYLKEKKAGPFWIKIVITLGIFVFALAFSFYQVKGKYNEQEDLLLIADVVRSLTHEKDLLVTDTQGDTTLLYLTNRRGFPAPYKSFEELKKQKAKFFITRDLSYKEKLVDQYDLIFENDKVLIFAL